MVGKNNEADNEKDSDVGQAPFLFIIIIISDEEECLLFLGQLCFSPMVLILLMEC